MSKPVRLRHLLLRHVARRIRTFFLGNRDVSYRVGDLTLALPGEHRLPEYQSAFDLYDRQLGLVAEAVHSVYPESIGVDIGANVGDSAAAIRARCAMPLVCIEGDDVYYDYLVRNASAIGNVTCVKSFVGAETGSISGHVNRHDGTSEIESGEGSVEAKSLPDIIRENDIDLSRVSFIKTDTDGFDFAILRGSESLITLALPALFFEYVIDGIDSAQQSLALIDALESHGYTFVVFDNYGNLMRSVTSGAHGAFAELNAYLISGLEHGGGVPYLDVFASANPLVIDALLTLEHVCGYLTMV